MLPTIVDVPLGDATGVVERVARSHFPSPELVHAAAGLFWRETVPERSSGLLAPLVAAQMLDCIGSRGARELVEGPRWRVEVAPGMIAVRMSDPVLAMRSAERALHRRGVAVDQMAAELESGDGLAPEVGSVSVVTKWSRKSRSNMVQRLNTLDYGPMFAAPGRPALMTLTYQGDWLTVAPDAATCAGHLLTLRKRFERAYGRPLFALWKREFQRRGAPHYHLFINAPIELLNGETFRLWVARNWSEIVDHPDPVQRRRGMLAGTAVDYAQGASMSDPTRIGVYFSKHGSFLAKDYQNEPPSEWSGSVGRFWGFWHLRPVVAQVEVAPDVARAAVRTARRWAAANNYVVRVPVWRKVTTIDRETGELGFRWRRRHTRVPVRRLRGSSGFLAVNDGPAFASSLSRAVERQIAHRIATGPMGNLP